MTKFTNQSVKASLVKAKKELLQELKALEAQHNQSVRLLKQKIQDAKK